MFENSFSFTNMTGEPLVREPVGQSAYEPMAAQLLAVTQL